MTNVPNKVNGDILFAPDLFKIVAVSQTSPSGSAKVGTEHGPGKTGTTTGVCGGPNGEADNGPKSNPANASSTTREIKAKLRTLKITIGTNFCCPILPDLILIAC